MNDNKSHRAVAFLQGAFYEPIPNFRQQLLDLGDTARLEPEICCSPATRAAVLQSVAILEMALSGIHGLLQPPGQTLH